MKRLLKEDKNIDSAYSLISNNPSLVDAIITGNSSVLDFINVKAFSNKIRMFARKNDNFAIALACFLGEPILFDDMEEESLYIFTLLLGVERYSHLGFSNGLKTYFLVNKDIIKKAAINNMYAQYLMGFWYVFDNHEPRKEICLQERRKWYEKAALNGMLEAMRKVAMIFDSPTYSFEVDYKKAAYWYRLAALNNDAICALNLGIMYLKGDGVEKNIKQAKLWLLHSLTCAEEEEKHLVEISIIKNKVELDYSLTLADDIELNPLLTELSNIYETNKPE